MMPLCCSRPEAGPPNMKMTAARMEAGSGQPRRQPSAPTATPPAGKGGVDEEIECPDRRRRIEQGPQHEGRREDQRLRIGNAGVPAVVIGVPERRMAGGDGGGQEAEEGVEMGLG